MFAALGGYPPLAGDKREAFNKFKKELLQLIYKSLFELTLVVAFVFAEVKEFKDIRVFENIVGGRFRL